VVVGCVGKPNKSQNMGQRAVGPICSPFRTPSIPFTFSQAPFVAIRGGRWQLDWAKKNDRLRAAAGELEEAPGRVSD
jgi:hypothetical protein